MDSYWAPWIRSYGVYCSGPSFPASVETVTRGGGRSKANGLEPYAYLRHVFTELPKAQSLAKVEALLPTRLHPADLARDSLQGSSPAARE